MTDSLGEPLLAVGDLRVGYDSSRVLQGVDLTIGVGESVALLGRNGMGKTTLVRALMGLKPPRVTAGSVLFAGVELSGARVKQDEGANRAFHGGEASFVTLLAQPAGQDPREAGFLGKVKGVFGPEGRP